MRLTSSKYLRSWMVGLFIMAIVTPFPLYAGEHGIWSRISTSFLSIDDYHEGGGSNFTGMGSESLASFLFGSSATNASVDIQSTILESSYSFNNGAFIYGALQWADIDVEGEPGSGLNYSESSDFRNIVIGGGFDQIYNEIYVRLEARYVINEDDSFDDPTTIIPTTDGSDSLILQAMASRNYKGFFHKGSIGYQIFDEADNGFPGVFELGDRFNIGYEIGKYFDNNNLYIGLANNYYTSQETDGNYLYNKPRANEVTVKVDYNWTELVGVDFSYSNVWEGSDVPKTDQFNLGLTLKV